MKEEGKPARKSDGTGFDSVVVVIWAIRRIDSGLVIAPRPVNKNNFKHQYDFSAYEKKLLTASLLDARLLPSHLSNVRPSLHHLHHSHKLRKFH